MRSYLRTLGGAAALFGLLIQLGGCVGVRVRYIVEPKADEAGLIKFRLPGSTATLAKKDKESKTGFVLDQQTVIFRGTTNAFTIQYVGKGSAATLTIGRNQLSTRVTAASAEDLKIGLSEACTLQELVETINRSPSYKAILLPAGALARCREIDPVADRDIKSSGYMATLPYGDDPSYFAEVGALVTQTPASEDFAIVVHDMPWQRTYISVTYRDAADLLIQELGVQLSDYRKEILQAVAAVAKLAPLGILGLVPEAPPKVLVLPVAIDVMPTLRRDDWAQLSERNPQWWYRVEVAPEDELAKIVGDEYRARASKDKDASDKGRSGGTSAVEAARFFFEHRNDGGESTKVFPVPACRTAVMHLTFSPTKPASRDGNVRTRFTISDPRLVQTVAIPHKGAIKMKSVCGADVTSGPGDEASVWQLIGEAANQVKAVKDAEKAAKPAAQPASGGAPKAGGKK